MSEQENIRNRKQRVLMNFSLFTQIKRFYKSKSIEELMEITSISRNSIYEAIRKIENCEESDPSFEALYKNPGRNSIDKNVLHMEIRDIMGSDNSLTQVGLKELLVSNISYAQLCREVKASGLSRKRLKKRANATLTDSNRQARLEFSNRISGFRSRPVLFLDESGFNLHTSINYGYSPVNRDAVTYQPNSRGRNISLCALISHNGILHSKVLDGAYNEESFGSFLLECNQIGAFEGNPILVMDNVRFHHCQSIESQLRMFNVTVVFLPPYSPDLNPIENVFSTIKSKLNTIRPRAQVREILKTNIMHVISELGNFVNYYGHFWDLVHSIINRERE